jgi:hypothetical protein
MIASIKRIADSGTVLERITGGRQKRDRNHQQGGIMKKLWILVLVLVGLPLSAGAVDRPTPQQALAVVDYYFNGQGQGALLMAYALCSEVAPEGEDKNECRKPADAAALPLGSEVFIWMNFLVPADEEASLLISFTRKDRVRKTTDLTLKGAIRYRTWKPVPTDKPGQWTVTIVQEMPDRDVELGSFAYTVTPNSP